MHKTQTDKQLMFNVIKLIWATMFLYLGLTLNVFNIWEKLSLTADAFQEVQQTGIENMDTELADMIWKHNSSSESSHNVSNGDIKDTANGQTEDLSWEKNEYKMKFQRICISNMSFCSKIKFEWDYEYKDKYMYLATSIYVLNNIEKNIQFGRTLTKQLDEIVINNEIWNRRWYATRDDITINLWTVNSYVEFFELLTHEMWHIVDLWMVRWFNNTKSNVYTEFSRKVFAKDDPSIDFYEISWQSEKVRRAWETREDFCSGYGMTDPFEDFAECHNMYLNHNAIFKKIAQTNDNMRQKYNFMANLYGGVYLFNAREDLSKIRHDSTWRPWDTTRM